MVKRLEQRRLQERTRPAWLVVALLVLVLSANPAAADGPERSEPTWLLGEVGIGPVFGTGFPEDPVGFGVRTQFGFGGGFDDAPLRFYLLASLQYSEMYASTQSGTLTSEITRRIFDIAAHVRTMVVFERLRLFFDIGIGGSFLGSAAWVNDRDRFETDASRFAIYVSGGLNYRLNRLISLGILVETCIPTARPESDFVSAVSRVKDDHDLLGWTSLLLTTSFHF